MAATIAIGTRGRGSSNAASSDLVRTHAFRMCPGVVSELERVNPSVIFHCELQICGNVGLSYEGFFANGTLWHKKGPIKLSRLPELISGALGIEPNAGVEPAALRLRVSRSTD